MSRRVVLLKECYAALCAPGSPTYRGGFSPLGAVARFVQCRWQFAQ